MIFAFLKRYYSALISSLIVVLIVYNPWTLAFKADVLSDIPFALIFGVLLVHFNSVKKKSMLSILIFSVLCAFMILIRSIGITFIIAILFQSIIEYSKYHISKNRLLLKSIYEKIIFSGISFLLFILFNKISSPQEDNGIFNYEKIIDLNLLVETIQTNMTYYSGVLRAFFEPWNDNWQFVAIITGSMIFTFIILGMIRKMSTQFNFTDSLFLVYLGIIMVYPYSNAGFRFLLPLIPILSLYLLIGILNTDVGIRLSKNKLAILLTAIVLFSYQKGIREACLPDDNIIEGPQVKENSEMFQYIISNTPPDARFSFKRPRALAFYTGRNSMTHRKEASQVEIAGNLKSKNIDYILINEEDHNQNMIDFLNSNQETINKIWENSKNKIYKIKKAL